MISFWDSFCWWTGGRNPRSRKKRSAQVGGTASPCWLSFHGLGRLEPMTFKCTDKTFVTISSNGSPISMTEIWKRYKLMTYPSPDTRTFSDIWKAVKIKLFQWRLLMDGGWLGACSFSYLLLVHHIRISAKLDKAMLVVVVKGVIEGRYWLAEIGREKDHFSGSGRPLLSAIFNIDVSPASPSHGHSQCTQM